MLDIRLYILQRLSALIMIPLTLGHIGIMIYAVQGGLTTAEILGRTQGSVGWLLFYGMFVLAVSVHAAIGLRVILHETFGVSGLSLSAFMWAVFLILILLGVRAVMAVTLL